MYADFFRSDRPRHSNPTFSSNYVQSTMLFPGVGYTVNSYRPYQVKELPSQRASQILAREQAPLMKRGRSNLSSYGSSSLGNLAKVSDKDVFDNQKKRFNIITMHEKQHHQTIKMFPKLRNQRKVEPSHLARQALINGRPQLVLKRSNNPSMHNPEQN